MACPQPTMAQNQKIFAIVGRYNGFEKPAVCRSKAIIGEQ